MPGSRDLVVNERVKNPERRITYKDVFFSSVVICSLCGIDTWLKQTSASVMQSAAGIRWVPI